MADVVPCFSARNGSLLLSGRFLDELAARLIGDKAYDSGPLDRHLDEG
jgi:hypothetical protein